MRMRMRLFYIFDPQFVSIPRRRHCFFCCCVKFGNWNRRFETTMETRCCSRTWIRGRTEAIETWCRILNHGSATKKCHDTGILFEKRFPCLPQLLCTWEFSFGLIEFCVVLWFGPKAQMKFVLLHTLIHILLHQSPGLNPLGSSFHRLGLNPRPNSNCPEYTQNSGLHSPLQYGLFPLNFSCFLLGFNWKLNRFRIIG